MDKSMQPVSWFVIRSRADERQELLKAGHGAGVQFDMMHPRMPDGRPQQLSALKLPIGLALSGRRRLLPRHLQDLFPQWGHIQSVVHRLSRVAFKGREIKEQNCVHDMLAASTQLHHIKNQGGCQFEEVTCQNLKDTR